MLFTINVVHYFSYSHHIISLFALFLETKQDIADYFDSTLVVPKDPTTAYTIHHHSGLDDDGQWRLLAVLSSESELYSYSHFLFKFSNPGLLSRLRDLDGRWVLAVDATSQISCDDLSVIFAGILHEDHGFVPIVATMQVFDTLFAPILKLEIQNRLDTTTFAKIFTIVKEIAPSDPTVVMADGDGAIRAAVTEVFPDTLKAMCWFHCKQACKRNMGKYPYSHYF